MMKTQTQAIMEEKLSFLFQPDTVLPAQYFNRMRRASSFEPEKALMLAVLEDAINCFKDNIAAESGNKKMLFEEAEEWIFDTSLDWVFSFENICEVFDFNPQYVRQALLKWKQQNRLPRVSANVWQERQANG